jgi:hypothetical protein
MIDMAIRRNGLDKVFPCPAHAFSSHGFLGIKAGGFKF